MPYSVEPPSTALRFPSSMKSQRLASHPNLEITPPPPPKQQETLHSTPKNTDCVYATSSQNQPKSIIYSTVLTLIIPPRRVVDALRDPPSPPWLGNDIDTLPQVGNPEDQPDKARERPSTDREEATQSHIINTVQLQLIRGRGKKHVP